MEEKKEKTEEREMESGGGGRDKSKGNGRVQKRGSKEKMLKKNVAVKSSTDFFLVKKDI